MSEVRWRLADFLQEHGLTAYALGKAGGATRMNTIYRIARRSGTPTRVDLPTLALVLDGLRKLTGKPVNLLDVLEYVPSPTSADLILGENSSTEPPDGENPNELV